MPKRILALDLGTHTGYAVGETRVEHHVSGLIDLRPKPDEGGGMRFLRFQRQLVEFKADLIYYEAVKAHKGTRAAHVYGGFVAVLQAHCEKHDIPYRGVPVGTIKKHATGKGNANKAAMVAAAQKRFGWPGTDDNIADALWLLDLAIDLAGQRDESAEAQTGDAK